MAASTTKRCHKHPKYSGRKKPKYECLECLKLYITLYRPRLKQKRPSPPMRSKKTYNRKNKLSDKSHDK